jgi:peroxiredoxin
MESRGFLKGRAIASNEMDTGLKPGDKAPEFRLPADNAGEVALLSLRGKNVILFFFPKALTPG